MTSLKEKMMGEANKDSGWVAHPVGTFSGVVEEVKMKEHEGTDIYEIFVRSDKGRAKVAIWRTSHTEIDGKLTTITGSHEKAEERYVKSMARLIRLYKDLGIDMSSAIESEEDQSKIEAILYDHLGNLADKACTIVVKTNANDHRNPTVFINAPTTMRQGKAGVTHSAPLTSDMAMALPDMEQIPF